MSRHLVARIFILRTINSIITFNYEMANSGFKEEYLLWYYNTNVWTTTTFMGIRCLKSVSDMWNYQEILYDLKPSLIIEVGTAFGGSALFFSTMLRMINPHSKVLSVDIDHSRVSNSVLSNDHIELLTRRSTDEQTISRIKELRAEYLGPVFVILDGDHTKKNVLAEMEMLRGILVAGDYLIVEDGIVNNHPVLPAWGEGPMEAIEEYEHKYPGDYRHDLGREHKFGFTFAPKGFLIRT